MIINKLICLFLLFTIVGCIAPLKSHQAIYRQQIEEIELAYKNKQITYAEYLNLKDNVEDAKLQRRATVLTAYMY